MLRALLLILALVVLIVIFLVWQGYIELSQTRPGQAQAPAFEVQVNPPQVGTTNIQVPTIRPADGGAGGNAAAPAPQPAPAGNAQ